MSRRKSKTVKEGEPGRLYHPLEDGRVRPMKRDAALRRARLLGDAALVARLERAYRMSPRTRARCLELRLRGKEGRLTESEREEAEALWRRFPDEYRLLGKEAAEIARRRLADLPD